MMLAPYLVLSILLLPLTASAAAITLLWDPGTGDPPTGYVVQRKAGTGAYAEIARPTTTTYTDDVVPTLTPVCWVVRAYNALGVSGPSNELCLDLPRAPVNLTIQTSGPAVSAPGVTVNTKVRKTR